MLPLNKRHMKRASVANEAGEGQAKQTEGGLFLQNLFNMLMDDGTLLGSDLQ